MKNHYPIFRDVKDWAILDTQIIHDFSPAENPIEIVLVLIGTLHYESIGLFNKYESHRTPITRWITKEQYDYFLKNEGVVIW